jgi:hypothetical protein
MIKRCPKCQSPMTEGVIVEKDQSRSGVSTWRAGAPVDRWWGVKLGGKPIPIQTWRCDRCSFLESYASG